jgi:hypothetical protein
MAVMVLEAKRIGLEIMPLARLEGLALLYCDRVLCEARREVLIASFGMK